MVWAELENAGRSAGLKADEIKATINSGKNAASRQHLDVEALRERLLSSRAA